MRKALVLVFAVLLLFSSCNSSKTPDFSISLPIQLTVTTANSNHSFKADITDSVCKITFDESHPLNGAEIEFSDSGATVTSGDFTRTAEKGIFPAQEALIKAVKAIALGKDLGIYTENGIKYAIDEMTVMVYYDKDTKQITGIGTEENGKRFDFQILAVNLYEAQSNGVG